MSGPFIDLIYQENISNITVLGRPVFVPLMLANDGLHYWMPLASKLFVTKCPALGFLDWYEDKDTFLFEKKVPFGNNEVLILGAALSTGFDRSTVFNLRLNLISHTFKVCTPFFDSFALNDYISVPSGHFIFFIKGLPSTPEDTVITFNVYRYDTSKDNWQEVKPTIMTHSPQTDCAVSFKNRYVYVFGIYSSEMYDLATNTWTSVETPWGGRGENLHLLHAAILGDQICVWLNIRTRLVYILFAYDPAMKIWQSHGEQCYHNTTETFFGKIFSLHYRPPKRCMNGRRPMLYLSLLSNDLVEQRRLVSTKKPMSFHMDYFHMTVLSRGTRLAIEQDKNVQQVEK